MKKEDIYHKIIKEFFDKIGLERTSPAFTSVIMERIRVKPEIVKNKLLPGLPYYLLAMFFTAGILFLPFNGYILNFVNNLIIKIQNVDFTFISDFILSITDLIRGYYISSTVMIIFASSTILFFTMILINYSGNFYKTLRVQMP